MKNSKLIKAFSWIFSILLIVALISLFTGPVDKAHIVIIVMLLAIVGSTLMYIPSGDREEQTLAYRQSYVAGYLSHLVIIVIAFLLALWELHQTGDIGVWFFVIILTVAIARPLIVMLLKAFQHLK